jgi:hypothetical protein
MWPNGPWNGALKLPKTVYRASNRTLQRLSPLSLPPQIFARPPCCYYRPYRVTSAVPALEQSYQLWSENLIKWFKKQKLQARTLSQHAESLKQSTFPVNTSNIILSVQLLVPSERAWPTVRPLTRQSIWHNTGGSGETLLATPAQSSEFDGPVSTSMQVVSPLRRCSL